MDFVTNEISTDKVVLIASTIKYLKSDWLRRVQNIVPYDFVIVLSVERSSSQVQQI